MTKRQRWWAVGLASVVLGYTAVSLSLRPGFTLTAVADVTQLALLIAATVVMVLNSIYSRGQTRLFWSLLAAGCAMWGLNQAGWASYEVILRRQIPDPFIGDIILFLHVVPMIAAVAVRPHRQLEQGKPYLSTLNFLMLLVWWVFLYAFVVFPDEYVVLNIPLYSPNYDFLYTLENIAFLAGLAALLSSAHGTWKNIYWNLFLASALYSVVSELINAAFARGTYYTGSLYDIPFVISLCWFSWAGLLALELRPSCESSRLTEHRRTTLAPRFAMLAILSLPILGYWAWFSDSSPPRLRQFRILVTLTAMLVQGCLVFIRQFLLDRELVRLLDESRQSLENLQRVQAQLVQREKLASLGQLVAGAAHEINNPLTAILGYSDLMAGNTTLEPAQISMAQKIGQQARRTRELVSGLLRFAQQSPEEKSVINIGSLLQRALQMEMLRLESKQIRLQSSVTTNLPPVWGNTNHLFQCFLEIIHNAMDALEEVGGGTLAVSARRDGNEVLIEFSDSGRGMRDPKRVFDPFYTTKPVGKGTGLGLSATYGVVQDHHGQISCHNRPEGGAVFVLRFPAAQSAISSEASAAKA
jgi:signal transduction histidine kinase